jgi:subtilisin family serine protease
MLNGRRVLACLAAALFATAPWAQAQNVLPGIEIETYDHRQVAAHEVLVKFRAEAETSLAQADAANGLVEGEDLLPPEPVGGISQLYRLNSRTKSVSSLLQELSLRPDVMYAEPNYIIHATDTPDDPYFGLLWALQNTGQSDGYNYGTPGADISAPAAWNVSTGSAVYVAAVVDSGIDYTHPDLAANVWSAPAAFKVTIAGVSVTCEAGTHGFNAITNTCDPMDDNGHGTHVSGIIGAVGNNALGVVGVNWTTSMMGVKFLDSTGSGTTANAINAIEFAIQARKVLGSQANVRVLSNSWGEPGGFSQALLDEIESANSNSMIFVAAAGNLTSDNDTTPFYPASYAAPNIIAVAATDNRDLLANFSNYGGQSVHLGAPGVGILSTLPGASYGTFSGTSTAAPYVAGAAMLLVSACPLTTSGIKSSLIGNVDLVPALATATLTGGRLNVNKAILACKHHNSAVVSPGSVSFQSLATQESSLPITVTLSNWQSTTLAITSIKVSGDFAVTSSTCGKSLAAQSSCAIAIAFTPAAVGYLTGTLAIVDNSSTSPQQVALAGTGLAPVAVSPADLDYPPQLVGTGSFAQTVTVVNNQSTALTLTGIAASGDFTQSNTCIPHGAGSGVLAPRAQCTATIIFQPKATGNRQGQLTVTGQYHASPHIVPLSGVGSGTVPGEFVGIVTPAVARSGHTATLLKNGQVLLAGGSFESTVAELYNASTGSFTPAGNLQTARVGHTATLLPSGKVLLAGGSNGSVTLSSAELYDPTAQASSLTGAMTVARQEQTATLLGNGTVLIAGGEGPAGPLASAELYNPVRGSFTAIGSMTSARLHHTATLLKDGTVLLAGGCDPNCLFSAEIYNPLTGQFSGVGDMLAGTRSGQTATLLTNGMVLLAGGFYGTGSMPTAELYNPSAKLFTATGEMINGAVALHAATLLNNGLVLLTGTEDAAGAGTWSLNGAQTYDPLYGLFTAASKMARARSRHTATALSNGQVLITGGDQIGCTPLGNGWCQPAYGPSAELYVPQSLPTITWPAPAAITYGAELGAAQLNATASVAGTSVYTPRAGTVLGAGVQELSATFTPADTPAYAQRTALAWLTVKPAALTAKANNLTMIYGAALPKLTGTLTGVVNDDSLTESFSTTATSASPVGSYPIVPSVAGVNVGNYAITAHNGLLQITPAGSTTLLTLSATAIQYSQSLTATATVKPASGAAAPTGTITFYNGSTSIGTATLSAGTARLTTATLPVGKDTLEAKYAGQGNYLASTSAAVSVTVSLITTTTSLAASPASPKQGAAVKLTATVKPAVGTAAPTGTVTFYNGSTSIGAATLSSGTASISISTLPVGKDTLKASYAAQGNYAASTSAGISVTVSAD